MIKIIKTVCNGHSEEAGAYISILKDMVNFNTTYVESKNIHTLTDFEINLMDFVISCYETLGEIPSCELVEDKMGIKSGTLNSLEPFEDIRSLKLYSKGILKSKLVDSVNTEIASMGALGETQTPEARERLRELTTLHDSGNRVYAPRFNFEAYYEDRLQRPAGMKFPCKFLNDKAGEMAEGEVTVVAGYTSHFKSTLATNIVYHNVLNYGFNGVVFSLETPEENFWINLLSRHSIGNSGEYNCIPAKKVKRVLLTDGERKAFDKVNADWEDKRLGNLFIIDEKQLDTKDPSEFLQILEEIDDLLQGNLHFFCVDYIQLLKNTSYSSNKSDAQAVGAYMEVFREATQGFRKGTKYEKKLIGLLLSQITRGGVDYANSNDGEYPGPSVLSDSSELEKSAHRVISTYTTDAMKASKEALVQVLKSRDGETSSTHQVFVTGDSFFFGDADLINGGIDEFQGELSLGDVVEDVVSSGGFGESDGFDGFGGGLGDFL